MIEIVHGDILDTNVRCIAHQVNCQNKMGSGLAKAIYTKYPEVKRQYHSHCALYKPYELLRTIQEVHTSNKIIVNCFSQLDYGYDGKLYTSYEAFEDCMYEIIKNHMVVAMPYGIGCGLGGAQWDIIERILKNAFSRRYLIL